MTAHQALAELQFLLPCPLSQPEGSLVPFAQRARAHLPLLAAALPAALTEVLVGLLDRVESAALFGGESCSFSQSELHGLLARWLHKASELLPPPPTAA